MIGSIGYSKSCSTDSGGQDYLAQFVGTPFYDRALEIEREAIELRMERLKRDLEISAMRDESSWERERAIDLKRDVLLLDLHEHNNQKQAASANAVRALKRQLQGA